MVPRPLVGSVGRGFFRLVRRFPPVFLLCCIAGLVVGVSALFYFGEPPPSAAKAVVAWLVGAGCILFYGGLALFWWRKLRQGSWQDFCDWAYGVFEGM